MSILKLVLFWFKVLQFVNSILQPNKTSEKHERNQMHHLSGLTTNLSKSKLKLAKKASNRKLFLKPNKKKFLPHG